MSDNKNIFDLANRVITDMHNEIIRYDADKLVLALNLRDNIDQISTLTKQIKECREALQSSNCPRPWRNNKTVKHCIQSGSCGCDNINVLKR